MSIESAEQAHFGKEERSQAEIDRINDSKKRLQILVDRATATVNMALENKFIPELDGARLYKFLENIAKESNDIDKPENSADKIVAYIEGLYERVKLSGDTEIENAEKLLEKFGGEGLIKKIEETPMEREETSYEKNNQKPGNKDSHIRNHKQKRKGSFLRL
ncbi:MAG: hypothetical protein AAB536_03570 [Patescibacteria group bacterium]|mgnify:CR=1 FL=1